jgi:hypothetical protein
MLFSNEIWAVPVELRFIEQNRILKLQRKKTNTKRKIEILNNKDK